MKSGKVAKGKNAKDVKKGIEEWKRRSENRRYVDPGLEGYWYGQSKCNRL